MSASPQPPPPASVAPRDEPVAQTNGSPPASSSPAQLATLLAKSLQETEVLKAELASAKRRADKAERLLATFQSSAQSPTNGSPPGSSHGAKPPQLPEAARKAILDADARVERAEQARDELEARLRILQDHWNQMERYYAETEVRLADARQHFSRVVADGGGPLVPVSAIPSQNAIYLTQPQALPALPSSRSHASSRSSHRLNIASQPFPSVSLPPPPSASSSRVRPRAGSMDAGYSGVLSGPGAPPPAKRPRSDRDDDRSRGRRYSLSPSNSPHPAYLSNGHAVDHPPHVAVHPSAAVQVLHPHAHYHNYPHPPRSSDDPRYAYPDQHRHRRRGRSTSRGRSSRSRSRSRASSMSIDELLLAATATPADDRAGPEDHPHPHSRAVHPSQHLHPSSRHRSPSPGRGEYHHLGVPHHSRARASSSVQLHPSAHGGPAQVASPPGPLPAPGQVQTYQTHIFAPPVTGAPVKKTKLGAAGSLGANGSVLTLGPTGSVISGPSAIGGGGFPPTNAQGQRICRQCGLPGRYKEGKCVEKWGPGPEGPGTVCDRCRKKMKRVERRGTLESQSLAAHIHHQPAAIHPSGAPQAAPGAVTNGRLPTSQGSDRSVHRSDTIPVHHSQSRYGPGSTQIISQSSYSRHDRYDRDHDPRSPYHESSYTNSRSSHRGPTPPGIATLPGSSTQEDDGVYDDRPPRSRGSNDGRDVVRTHKPSAPSVNGHATASSRSASNSPTLNAKGATSTRGSPRGSDGKSKSSDLMDVDADGEEVDADAEADADVDADADEADADADADPEADADAELLEAVDAAEANNATDEEWLKKEDA